MWKPGSRLRLAWAVLAAILLATSGSAQQPARTTVSDIVYRAEVGSIEALVTAAQGKTSVARGTPKVLDAREFRKAYKTVVKAPTGYAPLDQATTALGLR